MTIQDKEAQEILHAHEQYVNRNRRRWDRYRATFEDRFWDEHRWHYNPREGESAPIKLQTNMVRAFIDGFLAGLFYKGMRVTARMDPVMLEEQEKLFAKFEPGEPQLAIGALCERFLNVEHVDMLSDNAFAMALLYPECAFKLGIASKPEDDALDRVWFDALPPWEAVWDRKSRAPDQHRYKGHTYWLPREEFRELYGEKVDSLGEEVEYVRRPDVVSDGFTSRSRKDGPEDSVRLFELYDYTSIWEEDEADDESEGKPRQEQGTMRVYLVRGEATRSEDGKLLCLLDEVPFPFTEADGGPLAPVLPVILTPIPEYPMCGVSQVASIYEVNRERNYITSYMASAFRRDIQRVLMVKKDSVDENFLAEITSGRDQVVVPVEEDGPLGEIAQYLDQQPVSTTLFQYLDLLIRNQQETQGIADFTRGKALNYATATEVTALNDYTETTLGRIRKKMDRLLGRLCAMYLRVLREAIGSTFRVRVGKETKDYPAELLDIPWDIQLTDLANTPLAEAQRRGDFERAGPRLLELMQVATQQEDPALAKLAQVQIDHMVEIFDLPDAMSWRQLSEQVKPPEAEEEAAPAGEEAPLTPEEEAALVEAAMQDPSLLGAPGAPGMMPPEAAGMMPPPPPGMV